MGVAVIAIKGWAILVGPEGIGQLGVLQSILEISVLLLGLGIDTGLVRLMAAPIEEGRPEEVVAYERAALWWGRGIGGLVLVVCIVASKPLGYALLGDESQDATFAWVGGGIAFALLARIHNGRLNAYHLTTALAKSSLLGSVLGSIAGLGVIAFGGVSYVPVAVFLSGLSLWIATIVFVPELPARMVGSSSVMALVRLVRFGGPFTLSTLLGRGVMLALPLLILNYLDVESVGIYRASTAIVVGYLGFLIASMSQDYYPRIARADPGGKGFEDIVNQQLRIVTLIGGPVILGALALGAFVITILYTDDFAPAAYVLRWQLIGALFQFWSWIFAYGVLAHGSSRSYMAMEAGGGLAMLISTILGLQLLGLEGVGVGFMVGYALYAALAYWQAQRIAPVRIHRRALILMVLTLICAIVVLVIPKTLHGYVVGISIATLITGIYVRILFLGYQNESGNALKIVS